MEFDDEGVNETQRACTFGANGVWHLGGTKQCEVLSAAPHDALASWNMDGTTYYLRERPASAPVGVYNRNRVTHAQNGVWKIGNAYVKCSIIRIGSPAEYTTIREIKARFPSMLCPEIIYAWTEDDVGHFMITKAAGMTVFDAFKQLSQADLESIAGQVAAELAPLNEITSPEMIFYKGKRTRTEFMEEWAPPCYTQPADKEGFPTPNLPPFTPVTYPLFIKAVSGLDCPPIEGDFVLSLVDLHARNVIIRPPDSGPPRVTAIIDWEMAFFEPRWAAASRWPIPQDGPQGLIEWDYALQRAFAAHGSPNHSAWVETFTHLMHAKQQAWIMENFKHCEWPDLKLSPPMPGMVGYRWDLDERPEAQALVAAYTEEERKALWGEMPSEKTQVWLSSMPIRLSDQTPGAG